jgi:hypothetical protein
VSPNSDNAELVEALFFSSRVMRNRQKKKLPFDKLRVVGFGSRIG